MGVNFIRRFTWTLLPAVLTLALAFPVVAQDLPPSTGEPPAEEMPAGEPVPEGTGGEKDVEVELKIDDDGGVVNVEAGEEDRVSVGADLRIKPDEVILGDAVCVNGDLTVAGTVRGDAVCVLGALTLEDSAVVDGDVVAVGGTLETAPGAEIGGEKLVVGGGLGPIAPVLRILTTVSEPISGSIKDIAWEVVFFAFLMFLGLLVTVFMRRQLDNVRDHLKSEFPRSALLGIALVVLAPIALIALTISIIGLPFVPLLLLAIFVVLYFGYVFFAETLGGFIVGEQKPTILRIFVGLLLLQGLAIIGDLTSIPGAIFEEIGNVFGFAGSVIFICGGVLGGGGILYSRLGLWPLEKTREWHAARAGNRTKKTGEKSG